MVVITPDLAGYEEAHNRARDYMGVPIVLFGPVESTWPPGTPVDPLTGVPMDPTLEPISSAAASALVHGKVGFRAVIRGFSAGSSEDKSAGVMDRADVMLILPSAAASAVTAIDAQSFEARDWTCKIETYKFDGVAGIDRFLIYGRRISEPRL